MPNFRQRLSPARQRIYDRSNATTSIPLKASAELRLAVTQLPEALSTADPRRVQHTSQSIADEICRLLRVPRVTIQVQGTRPSNARGELHGLYTPLRSGATIKIWMITAKLGKVVACKTYLRTLLHEICHHLDYALLRLADSLHTDGFYKRENSLFYQVGGATVGDGRRSDEVLRS